MQPRVVMAESSDIAHDYRVQKEASSLARAGWQVDVLGFRAWGRPEFRPPAPFRATTLPIAPRRRRRLRNLTILWNSGVINLRLLFRRADVYHAHNTMFLMGMWLSARLHGGRFVYDAHEVQWEHGRVLAFLERMFIRRADGLINVAPGRARAVAERYGIEPGRITIVANYPVIDAQAAPAPRAASSGRLRLVYSGGYDLGSNRLDLLLQAMVRVPDTELHLIAFGYRDSEEHLRLLVDRLGLADRVFFHPLVRPEQVMAAIARQDVAVNMLTNPKNHLSIRHSSVNKMYEYMAAAMPTLCSDLDSFVEEFVETGAAIAVDATDAEDIARGLERVVAERERLPAMSARAWQLAVDRFNWATQEKELLDLYRSLTTAG